MNAAHLGSLSIVRKLIKCGADTDAVDPTTGFTAFHDACLKGNADCAAELVTVGCDMRLADKDGHTGMELGRARGTHGSKSGGTVQTTALMMAVSAKQEEAVELLLGHSADPSIEQSDGFTTVMSAAFHDNLSIVRIHIKHGWRRYGRRGPTERLTAPPSTSPASTARPTAPRSW